MSWAITGTRSPLTATDREVIANVLIRLDVKRTSGELFHHGDADGVDRYVAGLVTEWGHEPKPHPADWARYGKAAGPIRNRLMLEEGKPEFVIAFPRHDRLNKGTLDCVQAVIERQIDLLVVWLDR